MAQKTIDPTDEVVDVAPASSSPHFIRVVWRHKWHLLLGVVAGLILGALYYAQATPVYESSAQILVIKKVPDALPASGGNADMGLMEDYMATHQALIKSPVIVGDAVRKKNLQDLPSFRGGGDPTRKIIELLKVTRDTTQESRSASILSLSMRCREPGDCAVVLQAIIDSYKDFLDATYKNVSDDTVKLVTQAREILKTGLNDKEKEYQNFRIHNPLLWQNKEGVSPFREHLARIEARRSELLIRQTEIDGQLAALETALKEGRPRAELLALVAAQTHQAEDAGKTGGASPAKQADPILDLQDQMQILEQDYGPDHPQVQALKERIALLRARTGDDADPDPVQAHLALLREEAATVRDESETFDKLSKSEQANATGLFSSEAQNENYRNEINRSQQLFDGIVKRLQEINLVKDFGGYDARCISPPAGAAKVAPLALPVFGLAGMLGFLVGLGLVYLADLSDQGFRNPEDLRRRLGMPIVGHIPVFTKTKNGQAAPADLPGGEILAPALFVFHRPKSREAEAFRAVRTALFFRNRAGDHKVIQVTSPDMGDGKTTLAANLALSIAQSGKRVIIVDADCRRPRLHKLFGVSAGPGLAAVIGGKAELPDAVRQSIVPELSVLPCGAVPPNPAELLSQPTFPQLLEVLRGQYDYVIVDSPPLLAVTDPCIVAPHADGVLLTIRLSKTARPHAQRAKDILATLGVSVLGVVVNAVNRRGSDAYGYNYYYHYEYRSSEYKRDGEPYYYDEETNGDGAAAAEQDAPTVEPDQTEKPT